MPVPASAFRGHHAGILLSGDVSRAVRFVFDNRTGLPVLPVALGELEIAHATLCCPDELPESMHLQCHLEERADWRACETCDRWQACFGRSDQPRWATVLIESARWGGTVIRPEDVVAPNPLAGVPEARLCRAANAHRQAIRDLVHAVCPSAPANLPDPLVVGVDQFGFDIRAGANLLRVDFDQPACDQSAAGAALARRLNVVFAS